MVFLAGFIKGTTTSRDPYINIAALLFSESTLTLIGECEKVLTCDGRSTKESTKEFLKIILYNSIGIGCN